MVLDSDIALLRYAADSPNDPASPLAVTEQVNTNAEGAVKLIETAYYRPNGLDARRGSHRRRFRRRAMQTLVKCPQFEIPARAWLIEQAFRQRIKPLLGTGVRSFKLEYDADKRTGISVEYSEPSQSFHRES